MKKYKYGNCIPESIKIYNKLKKKGYNPKIVEGWVEVNDPPIDLLPNEECLKLYFPDEIKELEKNYYYNDYARVFQHTWIMLDDEIIDITKNQFDDFGGIVRYFEKCRYWLKSNEKLVALDLDINNPDEMMTTNQWIKYPKEEIKCKK